MSSPQPRPLVLFPLHILSPSSYRGALIAYLSLHRKLQTFIFKRFRFVFFVLYKDVFKLPLVLSRHRQRIV